MSWPNREIARRLGRLCFFAVLSSFLACSCAFRANTSVAPPARPIIVRRALCIGIDNYSNLRPVCGPSRDAREVARVLQSRFGFADVRLLTDNPDPAYVVPNYPSLNQGLVTAEHVRSALHALTMEASPNDDVIVYFSGHGLPGYIVTADTDLASLSTTAVSFNELLSLCSKCRACHTLLLLDSCYSGAIFNVSDLQRYSPAPRANMAGEASLPIERLKGFPSFQIISAGSSIDPVADASILDKDAILACADESTSYVTNRSASSSGCSLFTERMLIGLSELSGNESRQFPISSLGAFMVQEFLRLEYGSSLQCPQYGKIGGGPGELVLVPRPP